MKLLDILNAIYYELEWLLKTQTINGKTFVDALGINDLIIAPVEANVEEVGVAYDVTLSSIQGSPIKEATILITITTASFPTLVAAREYMAALDGKTSIGNQYSDFLELNFVADDGSEINEDDLFSTQLSYQLIYSG